MHIKISFIVMLFPIMIFAQEIITKNDSVTNTTEDLYIEKHNTQLNIKFDVTNDQVKYFVPFEGEKATIKTNLNASLGFVFSYKFVSVRLGIRPGLSKSEKEDKGKTDFFRIKVKLLFDKWTHRFEYNYTRGFYIENTEEFSVNETNSNYHVQFPNLTTNILSGSIHYSFNDNYSVKAIESNTESQLKSAGTIVLGINYSYYDISGTDIIKDENGDVINRTAYNDFNGFNAIINGGYHYTFVFQNYWFVNAQLNPGIGFDFFTTSIHSENNSENKNDAKVFFTLNSSFSAGYNKQKYYFGVEYNYSVNNEKFDDNNFNLQPIKNNFHVYIGYRFKAPKLVTKPVDLIEEKIPVLKDNDDN